MNTSSLVLNNCLITEYTSMTFFVIEIVLYFVYTVLYEYNRSLYTVHENIVYRVSSTQN